MKSMVKSIVTKILIGAGSTTLATTGIAAPIEIYSAWNTAAVSAISEEDTLAAEEMADAKITGAVSEYTAQVTATPKQNVSAATAQDSGSAMVRVCQCQEHFVMEGDWKTEWRKHVIEVHHGCCHWGDNEFTEAEMRKLWPEDFEDKTVEDTSEKEAGTQNTQNNESGNVVAHYWCSCGFHTTDKRELMKHTVEGNNKGDMIHSYNTTYKPAEESKDPVEETVDKEAAEKAAKEQAEREAAEKAAKEQAEREAAEKAAKEQAEREAAEKAAKEQAEREAAEKAAKEQAEREAAEKAAKEQAEREAAEKAAKEQAEREAAEKAARKAELEAAEKAWWESIEKKQCPKCGTEYPADAEHGCAVVYHEYKAE